LTLNIYIRKRRWKLLLFATAIIIVGVSLWYTHVLVKKIANDERRKITTWADAIHRKISLVNYTNDFFLKIQKEERKRVELLADAIKKLVEAGPAEDLTFYSEIIAGNTSIPVIQTDETGRILSAKNVDFDINKVGILNDSLRREFSAYPPFSFRFFGGNKNYLYYKDSKVFSELRAYLDDLNQSFFTDVVTNSASVPVIITDSTCRHMIEWGNLDKKKIKDTTYISHTISEMAAQNDPIRVELKDFGIRYIFYKDSFLLTQLQYYPYVQFGVIGIFLLIAYFMFSTARRSEQNQVWVGLAKETAHQLGTPLSSMMAWMEILKMQGVDNDTITEFEKDIHRLNTIAERFSKIGSNALLHPENIVKVLYDAVEYIKLRTSQKVKFYINLPETAVITLPLNLHLFEWVIENLCKNSVDAMGGNGKINISIFDEGKQVIIDISDTGKGITKSKFKGIFKPGYTSKQRGWGLGLSLSKRIISEYHSGKIFVKSSIVNQGTTFRIILRKNLPRRILK